MYDIGSRLKAARMQRGLTQKMLAKRIHKSIAAISGYESNSQMPPLDVLESIAWTLHVSLDYLVGLDHSLCYSAKNLTKEQKEFVDLLFAEFTNPTNSATGLSNQQVEIIRQLFTILSTH